MRNKWNYLLWCIVILFFVSVISVFPKVIFADVGPAPATPGTFEIILRPDPNTKDTYITNIATADVIGGVSGGAPGTPPDLNATDFIKLMSGQGRNTGILGDENAFVNAIIKNAGAKLGLNGKEAQLHQIYQQAIAQKVNPVIVVTIWGVEAGWQLNGTEFGCKPFGSGFGSQLSCSVKTLNTWMTYFEKQPKKPVAMTPACVYNDPFIYAYEKYTPVCAVNDSNSAARANFVKYFKTLMGK